MIEHIHNELIITSEHHQQRIDSVLAQLLPDYSRSQISDWIKSGAVTLNHKPCKPKDKVAHSDRVEINVDFIPLIDNDFKMSTAQNIPLDIIYEDDEVLVLNKPAGLVVHPGAGNRDYTLVNALLYHHAAVQHLPRAGIVHRLDKDTTGLLISAKTLSAHTALIRQMQARMIERHYLTLVQGYVISGGIIDTGYGRHPRNRLKMAVLKQGTRQAITHYSVVKRYKDFSLLAVRLMTGRTHQIRVHMEHINHPVVGDPMYSRLRIPASTNEQLRIALSQFKRQALHAQTISFYHPKQDNKLTFTAPIPDDFQSLITLLDEYDEC